MLRLAKHPHIRERLQLVLAIALLVLVIWFGTLGYVVIEHWSYADALYMTVITLATVGFQEVHPLTPAGRMFTIVLILAGVGMVTVLVTVIAREILEKRFLRILKGRNMMDIIERLEGHTVMCGFGRLSRIAAAEIRSGNITPVVIERDEERAAEAESGGLLIVRGDATQDEALLRAGVKRAARLVSLLPNDADNLYVILTARELNPALFIVSRAEHEAGEKRMLQAGADKVIAPYRIGGHKIAASLLRPYVSDFLDVAATGSSLKIEEIKIPGDSPLNGRTLRDSELRQRTNVIIAAIIPPSGVMRFNPAGDTVLESGSTLIGLGYADEFAALEKLLIG